MHLKTCETSSSSPKVFCLEILFSFLKKYWKQHEEEQLVVYDWMVAKAVRTVMPDIVVILLRAGLKRFCADAFCCSADNVIFLYYFFCRH